MFEQLQNQPDILKQLITPQPIEIPGTLTPPPAGSPWTSLANRAPFQPGAMLLLTSGNVLVQDQGFCNCGSSNWWKLIPDINGSYLDGTWTEVKPLPFGYAPLDFASAVLPDGRVIIEGGEYNNGEFVSNNLGAIYDPIANTWTHVSPPAGWVDIDDAPGIVLTNGQFMLGAIYSTAQALLNAGNLTWTSTGSGKADENHEEGWTLLPSGHVLTVDTNNLSDPTNSEIFHPETGAWIMAGSTIVQLDDDIDHEVGPAVLRPNGKVFAVGATGANAVYNTLTGSWSVAPDFPVIDGQQFDVADGPAAVLPSGRVLVMASPGVFQTPSHFFVYDGSTLTQVTDPPNAALMSSFAGYMLVLPTGQIMFNSRMESKTAGSRDTIQLYTDNEAPNPKWAPAISVVKTTLSPSQTYSLSGTQLHGLSQGAAYGDNYQSATNYPLVRIVNRASGHVFYARTFGYSTMSVRPNAVSSTQFTVPKTIEAGDSDLYVVANGIPSQPVRVTITD
jgi:hypothetical protein